MPGYTGPQQPEFKWPTKQLLADVAQSIENMKAREELNQCRIKTADVMQKAAAQGAKCVVASCGTEASYNTISQELKLAGFEVLGTGIGWDLKIRWIS
jgi:aspartate/glutamate racemase